MASFKDWGVTYGPGAATTPARFSAQPALSNLVDPKKATFGNIAPKPVANALVTPQDRYEAALAQEQARINAEIKKWDDSYAAQATQMVDAENAAQNEFGSASDAWSRLQILLAQKAQHPEWRNAAVSPEAVQAAKDRLDKAQMAAAQAY